MENCLNNKIIYPFKGEDFVTRALSEKRISLDYLDTSRKQTLKDFQNYTKPIFLFAADDFLILISTEVYSKLQEQHYIDLHEVSQFGWYYEKRHKVNTQIFASYDSIKINNLLKLNPDLRIDSFDKLRDDFKVRKTLNVFSGALALCYHCFKDDYDNFFSKLKVDNSSLKISRSDLDQKNDSVILLQLLLIHNPYDARKKLEDFWQEKNFYSLYGLLSASYKYFYSQTYSMIDFLSFISSELSKDNEYKTLVEGFEDLKEKYVRKGLKFTPSDQLVAATKEFLDIAKTESEKLRSFLDVKPTHTKTAIFLLGMLFLGDRLEEQFEFSNFIPSLVDILVIHTKDIKITDGTIEFELDQSLSKRNSPFKCLADYLEELQKSRQLIPEYNKLKEVNFVIKNFIDNDLAISSIRKENEKKKKEKEELEAEKAFLEDQITKLQKDKNSLKVEIKKLEKDKEELERQKNTLKNINTSVQPENAKSELDQKDLDKNNDSVKSKSTEPTSEVYGYHSEVGKGNISQNQKVEKHDKQRKTNSKKLAESNKSSMGKELSFFSDNSQKSTDSTEKVVDKN
ncbi:MAG: hypothetical protein NC934_04810 [Candidatus Omnitrophica bacterium]|nr:hypothetical protein [Candidatus Omnitrophota bacterium]